MSLSLDLRLDDRQPDRIVVSVRVVPEGDLHPVDGIALELCNDEGDRLCPRLLLPISGALTGPLETRAELRSRDPIPPRSKVRATAWWGCEQVEASCPSEQGTRFESHMRGRNLVSLANGQVALHLIAPEERACITRSMPWIDEPMVLPDPHEIEPVDTEETAEEYADAICAELGLDDTNAAWIKELLEG